MSKQNAHVPAPALEWRDGTPMSPRFDDVYFSRAGGVKEGLHVFLTGNGLPGRWANRAQFTIGELGFGTGLNFLITCQQFHAHAAPDARLHYIAIEQFPFTRDMLRPVLAQHPSLAHEAQTLLDAYPLRLPGMHRIHLGRVTLTLCFGDAAAMLHAMHAPTDDAHGGTVDAWYLDGFAPAKNPAMWHEDIYQAVARLSAPEATFATFTAASHVRRGLAAAGFTVSKIAGFGKKREMSVGIIPNGAAGDRPWREPRVAQASPQGGGLGVIPPSGAQRAQEPAAQARRALREGGKTLSREILIIGAGIAGATLAHALATRGYAVTVLEAGAVGSGASGNAAGVLFPQITKQWGLESAWYFTAYGYALRQLRRWREEGLVFDHAHCGMLRLPRTDEEAALLENSAATHAIDPAIMHWVVRDAAREICAAPVLTGGTYFPQGTWVNPAQLCAALLQHGNITLRTQSAVKSLARHGGGWQVTLTGGEAIDAAQCCVASAFSSAALLEKYGLTLGAVGGQVSLFKAADAATTLRSILCHKGYVIPARGHLMVGATYHREALEEVTPARHEENKAALDAILPGWLDGSAVTGRSSLRATTPDRMPYVGALDDGLYVSTGHGSRGLLSAPLAAEIIVSSIAREVPPVTRELLERVHSRRFKKG